MPQSERSDNIKKLLRWLLSQEKGATTSAILHHAKWEISEGGATDNTVKKYIEDLHKAGLTEYVHPFCKISKYGKEWLEKHNI